MNSVAELADGVLAGNRRLLARSITLIESSLPADRERAEELLERIYPATGRSFRVGLSGVPGAGKSTFIESFGLAWIERGRRVAVLAVDPSSSLTGGSVLGDKTRMQKLGVHEAAFIRPSPTSGTLGGVTRRTREAMLLCEAAGYDGILVETVGVGQSEVAVAEMTDFYLLLMLPNAGDELQGIKKGILELADCMLVNKVDQDEPAAMRSRADLKSALRIIRSRIPDWEVPVLLCSGLNGTGLDEIFAAMDDFLSVTGADRTDGFFQRRRQDQRRAWLNSTVHDELLAAFDRHPGVRSRREDLERQVLGGSLTPSRAAHELLETFLRIR